MDVQGDFVSGFSRLLGVTIVEWRDGFVRGEVRIGAALLNRGGSLHGGVLLSLMDDMGGAAGAWCPHPDRRRYCNTVSLNGQFVAPAREGLVLATSEITGRGRSLFFVRSEVRDEDGRLLAFGASTHRWRSGSADPAGVPLAR